MGALCCKPEPIDFEAPVNLYHFFLLRSIGKGAFGKVRVIQHKQTKQLFALKYINKQRCIKQHAVSNILQERRLLEEIDSNFVCNLRYAFQDDENLFMVLDLMLGGDLRFHLDRQGHMPEHVVRFYVAELALGLDYLHSRGIVHRDLKPDNVLLDEKGHAHLTDFNIAVHFTERRALTSVAGSMAYMAPEVLTKRGYFATIDWWSLGVVAYELLFGKRPFRGKTNSSLTHSILRDQLRIPDAPTETPISTDALDCLRGLLERDITKRLGCRHMGGFEALKGHPWFRSLDWTALAAKQVTPPFEPDSKKANFDATHELEELLLEDNPLKAKKRHNQDLTQLSDDLRQMEEGFLVFDYNHGRKAYFSGKGGEAGLSSTITVGSSFGVASASAIPLDHQPCAETSSRLAPVAAGEQSMGDVSPRTSVHDRRSTYASAELPVTAERPAAPARQSSSRAVAL